MTAVATVGGQLNITSILMGKERSRSRERRNAILEAATSNAKDGNRGADTATDVPLPQMPMISHCASLSSIGADEIKAPKGSSNLLVTPKVGWACGEADLSKSSAPGVNLPAVVLAMARLNPEQREALQQLLLGMFRRSDWKSWRLAVQGVQDSSRSDASGRTERPTLQSS